jgi:PAP2 superfamily
VLAREWLATLADWVYIWGFWPVLAAAAIFLYARHRDEYVLLRNAVFISGLIGFVFFALMPVAPPRLADPSVVDTIREHTTWWCSRRNGSRDRVALRVALRCAATREESAGL